ncbi:hypothetical protein ACSSS7_002386 [Eimeria intestinalis]
MKVAKWRAEARYKSLSATADDSSTRSSLWITARANGFSQAGEQLRGVAAAAALGKACKQAELAVRFSKASELPQAVETFTSSWFLRGIGACTGPLEALAVGRSGGYEWARWPAGCWASWMSGCSLRVTLPFRRCWLLCASVLLVQAGNFGVRVHLRKSGFLLLVGTAEGDVRVKAPEELLGKWENRVPGVHGSAAPDAWSVGRDFDVVLW